MSMHLGTSPHPDVDWASSSSTAMTEITKRRTDDFEKESKSEIVHENIIYDSTNDDGPLVVTEYKWLRELVHSMLTVCFIKTCCSSLRK